jgi:hypothetical protein
MDSPSGTAASSPNPADRRRSGRVTRQPQHLAEELTGGAAKRKRVAGEEGTDDEEEEDESDEEASEADEEEVKETRKRSKKTTPAKSRPAKKARENGEGTSLAIRPAKKPRKRAVRFSAAENASGLYGSFLLLLPLLFVANVIQLKFMEKVVLSMMLQPNGCHRTKNNRKNLLLNYSLISFDAQDATRKFLSKF